MPEPGFDETELPHSAPAPDFNKFDRERRERILGIPYSEISQYPEILRDFTEITTALNHKRRFLDLPPVDFPTSSVRLISSELYNKDVYLSSIGENGAFFSSETGAVFIRFDEQEYTGSRLGKMKYVYTLTHELSHKGMDGKGIKDYSFDLNEGIADLTAREILEDRILPHYLETKDFENRRDYVAAMSPSVQGVPLVPDDIILEEPGQSPMIYLCIPQMYALRQIQYARPDTFTAIVGHAFAGNTTEARKAIAKSFGTQIADTAATKGNSRELGDSILRQRLAGQ